MSTRTTLHKEFEETLRTTDFEGFLIDRIEELELARNKEREQYHALRNEAEALEAALEQEKKYDIEKQRDIWADNCKKAWSQRDAAIARYERAEATIDAIANKIGYDSQAKLGDPWYKRVSGGLVIHKPRKEKLE